MSTITLASPSFEATKLNRLSGRKSSHFGKDSVDASSVFYNKDVRAKQVISSIEHELVSVSTPRGSNNLLDLLERRKPLITQRNKILASPYKRYIPKYRKMLVEIDKNLDGLDLKIYELESRKQNNEIKKTLSDIKHELQRLKKSNS